MSKNNTQRILAIALVLLLGISMVSVASAAQPKYYTAIHKVYVSQYVVGKYPVVEVIFYENRGGIAGESVNAKRYFEKNPARCSQLVSNVIRYKNTASGLKNTPPLNKEKWIAKLTNDNSRSTRIRFLR